MPPQSNLRDRNPPVYQDCLQDLESPTKLLTFQLYLHYPKDSGKAWRILGIHHTCPSCLPGQGSLYYPGQIGYSTRVITAGHKVLRSGIKKCSSIARLPTSYRVILEAANVYLHRGLCIVRIPLAFFKQGLDSGSVSQGNP